MLLYSLHELTTSQVRAHQTIATHMHTTPYCWTASESKTNSQRRMISSASESKTNSQRIKNEFPTNQKRIPNESKTNSQRRMIRLVSESKTNSQRRMIRSASVPVYDTDECTKVVLYCYGIVVTARYTKVWKAYSFRRKIKYCIILICLQVAPQTKLLLKGKKRFR